MWCTASKHVYSASVALVRQLWLSIPGMGAGCRGVGSARSSLHEPLTCGDGPAAGLFGMSTILSGTCLLYMMRWTVAAVVLVSEGMLAERRTGKQELAPKQALLWRIRSGRYYMCLR